ncbi:hypothetical protein CR203_11595 [Salipaludibacillus neizhouensis]|uniref:Uncharacterized protein n=1 Tax=Salipaludibacillus neizhouensis TaxID=885475 RepID=A0A3A9K6T0_9BACI|nr:hypothetical protein [Salipaludibacillus neizhouensis]RKL67148.1 hypothetical protein CR203_11595 [Salipaludibacillus neizhouensis]
MYAGLIFRGGVGATGVAPTKVGRKREHERVNERKNSRFSIGATNFWATTMDYGVYGYGMFLLIANLVAWRKVI